MEQLPNIWFALLMPLMFSKPETSVIDSKAFSR